MGHGRDQAEGGVMGVLIPIALILSVWTLVAWLGGSQSS
jgi:hypothetical protein